MQKLGDRDIEIALRRLTEGASLRSLARAYECQHTTLRKRLILRYGLAKYQIAVSRHGTTKLFQDAVGELPSRHKLEASLWLEKNREKLLEIDLECPPDKFYSEKNLFNKRLTTLELYESDRPLQYA